jgi:hypothetical protein
MKIKRLRLKSLRNEEWFNFFTEFKKFVEETTPEALDIEALFVVLMIFYRMADEALEPIRKSNYSSTIRQLDKVRGEAFVGLNTTMRAALKHFDMKKRTAAERLVILFDHYSDLSDRPYNEETASIYNFLQDIRAQYPTEIAELELTGWLNELERTNTEFENAILSRNREYVSRTKLNMLEVRRQAGRAYLDIVERIEALSLINGDEKFATFVNTLNANIERYKTAINRRIGTNAAKTESENESESEGEK